MTSRSELQSSAAEYLQTVDVLVGRLLVGQLDAISRAGALIAGSIAAGGRVWVAESDHILASEATYRAGGLLAVERLGIRLVDGDSILEFRDDAGPPTDVDVGLFASSAGTDRRSVELAIRCREAGIALIVLASQEFAGAAGVESRHPSGLRLRDLSDVYVDIGGRAGDAALSLPGLSEAICPTSGVLAAAAMWAIFAGAASTLLDQGLEPLVYRSILSPGGEEAYKSVEAEFAATGVGYRRTQRRVKPG